MKKIRITANGFCWGAKHYPPGTVESFHPHVADAIVKRQAGVIVGEEKKKDKFFLAETPEEEKPAEEKPKPRRRRSYRRRDLQAES